MYIIYISVQIRQNSSCHDKDRVNKGVDVRGCVHQKFTTHILALKDIHTGTAVRKVNCVHFKFQCRLIRKREQHSTKAMSRLRLYSVTDLYTSHMSW